MTTTGLEKTTEGAWLLAKSKSLDNFQGANRLENISYAGSVGRFYNVLRRGAAGTTTELSQQAVVDLSRLNNIDRATREQGLQILSDQGRIDVANNGSISILGATSRAVLEVASDIFNESNPDSEERAVIALSDKISQRPLEKSEAAEFISDGFGISKKNTSTLIDICKQTGLVDEETDRDRVIVFNSNLFKDGTRARKAYFLIESLNAIEATNLRIVEEQLRSKGAIVEGDIEKILGPDLFRRLIAIGYLDRMEINNSVEAVGYMALPDAFQKFGRPFEEDPIDDAKALLASLTYGMTRSGASRGNITMPIALLNKLIAGLPVGPVTAIGQDYKELERRGVVSVFPDRYAHSMTLLKKDVGELALTILAGGSASERAVLMGGVATSFTGPSDSRKAVRQRQTVEDRPFMTEALDRIRSGG